MNLVSMRAARVAVAALACAFSYGCAGTKESASKDKLTSNVGQYSPPPNIRDEDKPKVGVPTFTIQQLPGNFGGNKQELEANAADQMTTLLVETNRFNVIERSQLEQLLKEQDMEGIVRGDQIPKAGQVQGTDYLLLGKVTNFRVRQAQTKSGVDVGGIGGMIGGNKFGSGSTGFDKKNQQIRTEVGVDIRLVDTTTGQIVVAKKGEFNRTDSADALGISVFGMGGHSDAQMTIEEDDAGRILRLAFDDAVRQMLPEIDKKILSKRKGSGGAARSTAAPSRRPARDAEAEADANEKAGRAEDAQADPGTDEDAAPAPRRNAAGDADGADKSNNATAAKKFCPECGEPLAAGAKFCPKCGAKIQ